MRRRELLLAAGGLFAAPLARAQHRGRMPTLGLLYPNPSRTQQGTLMGLLFAPRLKELGWVVGQNLLVETASGEGREDRMPALAEELVRKGVDVIWAAGPEAATAAARATTSIPIVFYGVGYPVDQGLVESLARPGRNVTGLTSLAGTERQKGLELLREAAPKASRLAWIRVISAARSVSGDEARVHARNLELAAQRLGFEYRPFPVSRREEFDAAFEAIRNWGAQSFGADFAALTARESQRLAGGANQLRLPSVFGDRIYVEAGGLLSYGAGRIAMTLQSFSFVDRVLRGARPADLPVELPSKFELAVNLGTARNLGLTLPQSLLLRADRVIE